MAERIEGGGAGAAAGYANICRPCVVATVDRLEATLRERRYITVLTKPGLSEDPRRRSGRSITEWVLLR